MVLMQRPEANEIVVVNEHIGEDFFAFVPMVQTADVEALQGRAGIGKFQGLTGGFDQTQCSGVVEGAIAPGACGLGYGQEPDLYTGRCRPLIDRLFPVVSGDFVADEHDARNLECRQPSDDS